jgi:hypothetical protein
VHDGIDRVERRVRLAEEAFDVQLIGNVRAYRHRGAVGRQELLDERLGTRLIVQVVDNNGVATRRQRTNGRAPDTA